MKYIKLFENHSNYEDFVSGGTMEKPNVSHCIQENDVHYNGFSINGHKFIDLGLPSGALWASMNIGANSETEGGLFFAWAETDGYTSEQITGDTLPRRGFFSEEYKYYVKNTAGSGYAYFLTKYCYNASMGGGYTDNLTELEPMDDAAVVNWGGGWVTPSQTDMVELLENTTSGWTSDYKGSGVPGLVLESNVNGNIIFFPAAGRPESNDIQPQYQIWGEGTALGVWSRSLCLTNYPGAAFSLTAGYMDGESGIEIFDETRIFGCNVRPIYIP